MLRGELYLAPESLTDEASKFGALRLWWKEGKRRSIMLPHGWLFPGRSATDPVSTRQINRATHEAAEAPGTRFAGEARMLR